jgi:L-2-hydroxyglutarate oxidase LhgO
LERVECAVIGAGVVGLAVARALALAGREVLVLESEDAFGTATSARNSEVIHAGIYYPPGTAKARLCVAGRDALYRYCAERGLPHRRCGKLIVATDKAQHAKLEAILAQAHANGVPDLAWLDANEAHAMEPQLHCTRALLSPSTGIIDSHALMLSLLGDAEAKGAVLALRAPVQRGELRDDGVLLQVGGADPMELLAGCVVNAAGLHAHSIARALDGFPAARLPPQGYAKGNYYALAGRSPFSRLVYPVPEAAGLGVHLTLDMAGQARFGPDVEWVQTIDYRVDPARADGFYAAIRRYWPDLPDGALSPGYAGIRPKLHGPEGGNADFLIQGPSVHGVAVLVNLFGIESPGLTASLAIADEVLAHLG